MTILQRAKICKSCDECSRKSEMFKDLSKEETDLLNQERYEVHFKAGENIIKQGTFLTHITNLVQGFAKVYIEGYDNRNLLLSLEGAHTLLGGPGLFTDNRNHYTVTALEDSIVCFINTDNFKKVLLHNPVFCEKYLSHLNERTIYSFEKMVSLTQKQMHGRMADALIFLSEDVYLNAEFEIPLSRQDLADMTAMSKDSAIRILKEFEKDGLALVNGKTVKILKPEALHNLSDHG